MNNFESSMTCGFEVLTSKLLSENFLLEDGTLSFEEIEIPTVLFSYTDYTEFCIRCREKNEKIKMRKVNNKILTLLATRKDIYNESLLNTIRSTMEIISGIVFSPYTLNNFYAAIKSFSYVFIYVVINRGFRDSKDKIKIRLNFAEKNDMNTNIANYLRSRNFLGTEN